MLLLKIHCRNYFFPFYWQNRISKKKRKSKAARIGIIEYKHSIYGIIIIDHKIMAFIRNTTILFSFSHLIYKQSLNIPLVDFIYLCNIHEINKIKSKKKNMCAPATQIKFTFELCTLWNLILKMCEFIQFILKSMLIFIHHRVTVTHFHSYTHFSCGGFVLKKTQSHTQSMAQDTSRFAWIITVVIIQQ